ncbi:response regulator [Peribacillus simplex]|uniref:Response regulator n=1 Tax=Peribacillus simplex TaxID=1478 RepID=A0AAW7IU33_9BACI|nr:response regulator [Peribacillus simplex]SNT52344.1 two-component system, response regulator YcbB [Bacillus sp. OK838]AMM91892.1 transcriptional regulator [Peribacillus simplex]MDM5296125.1 response regulator [Peribacillus simplex]MDM5455132.1 response regulator [Peribacillus simplex]RRN70872.1 response regulator [Peribacillus simplex]
MRFFITDDDCAIRSNLSQIIENEDLGEVVEEAEDGSQLEGHILNLKQIDILFIDLLMPIRDGIETLRHIKSTFNGKIIMISQVESKELIGEAYSLGIDYYITKPINRIEILTVIRKVMERIHLERSITNIQASLNSVLNFEQPKADKSNNFNEKSIKEVGEFLLSELGVVGENGAKDLIEMLQYLFMYERTFTFEQHFPTLKDIFEEITKKKLGTSAGQVDINREMKAAEQRIRRTINHSLNHFASLGLTDFSNPKFENYASKFFDFTVVRQKMKELQKDSTIVLTPTRVNTKKFIQVFFFEAKRLNPEEINRYR